MDPSKPQAVSAEPVNMQPAPTYCDRAATYCDPRATDCDRRATDCDRRRSQSVVSGEVGGRPVGRSALRPHAMGRA